MALLTSYSPVRLGAAELKADTLQAWNQYIEAQTAGMAERSRVGPFLWSDESADRNRRLHEGELLVAPIGENVPQSVPHGLIHHWIGAVFLPGVHLDDVFTVVRDYDHYKNFYAPVVIDSKPIHDGGRDDEFSMLMLNKALFSRFALDGDFQESYVRVDKKRWYSIGSTVRLQEIHDYGQPTQRELPLDTGNGYIWRLCNMSRFEERDGGVYVELEAIALSRGVPVTVRWVVDPVVRRVSRDSLLVSLQKTQAAVRSTHELAKAPQKDAALETSGLRVGGANDAGYRADLGRPTGH